MPCLRFSYSVIVLKTARAYKTRAAAASTLDSWKTRRTTDVNNRGNERGPPRELARVLLTRTAALLCTAVALISGMTAYAGGELRVTLKAAPLPVEGELPSLGGATDWLNSPRLSAASLRGKVVLIDFWTYSCVNWRRSLPYVRAWADKYRDHGLVVIGAHAPEFRFETVVANVRRAVQSMNIDYPVAIDNQYALWDAFANQYWPAIYLIDAQGRIRYHHFGEGDYEQTERIIQRLLSDSGATGYGPDLVSVQLHGPEVAADLANLQSPENYLGYARSAGFVSRDGTVPDHPHPYASPARLQVNAWALQGAWVIGAQSIVLQSHGGRIAYAFHARDLHLVMGVAGAHAPIRFRVTIDGHAPGAAHGVDVDAEGYGRVAEPRMYQLIRQPESVVDRQFEIQFRDAGVEAFAFTFG
jgi:thiol-disulfide isomerase/thioredoxin